MLLFHSPHFHLQTVTAVTLDEGVDEVADQGRSKRAEWAESDQWTDLPSRRMFRIRWGESVVSSGSQTYRNLDRRELDMQTFSNSNCRVATRSRGFLLNTYECNEEFSLFHWLHVRKLVDEADIPGIDAELAHGGDADPAPKKPVSEVEPAATYQHFARNVV
jgi:hypothetical protein